LIVARVVVVVVVVVAAAAAVVVVLCGDCKRRLRMEPSRSPFPLVAAERN